MGLFGGGRRHIRRLRAKGDIEGLVAVVEGGRGAAKPGAARSSRDIQVRIDALAALGDLYGSRVEDGVAAGLADPHPEVRHAAVQAVAKAQLRPLTNGLIAGLVYWDPDDYALALAAAERALVAMEVDDRPERLGVVLVQNGKREFEEVHSLLLRTWISEDPRDPEECREAIGARLVARVGEPEISVANAERAAELMAELDGAGARPLSDLLWTSDPPLSALHIAARLRDNRLLEPLVTACGHEHRSVRKLAVKALGAIQDSRAVGVLLHATRDPDFEVRSSANAALESMGVTAVIFGLAATIQPELAQEALPGANGLGADELRPGVAEGEQ